MVLIATFGLAGCEQTTVATLEVDSVEVEPGVLSLVEGEVDTLAAILRERRGRVLSGREVMWVSDDPAVAAVSSSGVVEGVAPGTTTVRARSEGIEGTAEVVVVSAPALTLSPESVLLEAVSGDPTPAEAQVDVDNAGGGSLGTLSLQVEGGVEGGVRWIEADLLGASAPTRVRLRATAESLPPGSYAAIVEVAAENAVNSPRPIQVRFDVEESPPEISVEPRSVELSAVAGSHTAATQTVEVRNVGGGTLEPIETHVRFPPGEPRNWLTVSAPDPPRAPATLTLSASSRLLPPGSYDAWVEVTSPAAPGQMVEVHVRFTVGMISSQAGHPVGSVRARGIPAK